MTLTAPECDPDEFHHKATKLELLQALLVVLCPGPETYRIFDQNQSHYVPALYFIGRIEPEDWEDFAGRYTLEQFLDLAHHSLHAARIPALSEAVWDFLEDQRTRDQSSLMARYAGGALRAAGA
jgi:hypothetical protein